MDFGKIATCQEFGGKGCKTIVAESAQDVNWLSELECSTVFRAQVIETNFELENIPKVGSN